MDMDESAFEWKDEYEIGVEEIDNAHKQLFKIVTRIINNFSNSDFDKNKTTCIEAIKFLKSYTIKHFAEEEAYQIRINHPGYMVHKKIHDNMRNVVVPALENEVVAKGYSKESLEHFVGVCAGWLTAHVLIEDRAITGKTQSRWAKNINEDKEAALNSIIRGYTSSLFLMNAELFSKKYSGHKLGKLFCYNDILKSATGTEYSVTTAIEYPILKIIARRLVKQESLELDSVILPMLSEMLKTFNIEVMMAFLHEVPIRKDSKSIPEESFYAQYDKIYPDYSMLWRTYCGYLAFTIKKADAKG